MALGAAGVAPPPPVIVSTPSVTVEPAVGPIDPSPGFRDNWERIRADDAIQYDTLTIPEREPPSPGWLERFFAWLGEVLAPLGELLVAIWPVLQWVVLAGLVGLALLLLYRLLSPLVTGRSPGDGTTEERWAPERREALALLEDADRLAGEGNYDAATHLLLQRSVGQISAARPDWVEPSSTARELASMTALPDNARTAFATIAERVEKSLFALRSLGRDDWQAARDAYARFALERL